jgi:hypothetical protein
MSFVVMDMLSLTFQDETFDAVLDKGALDALFSDSSKEVCNVTIVTFFYFF